MTEDLFKSFKDPLFNEKSIIAARKFVVAWERWLEENRPGCTEVEVDFHEMTIRYAKGVIKLWRIWLSQQPRTSQENSTHGALAP